MNYSEIYAKRIRQLCKQRGLSINKLAEMAGLRQSSIDNIVNGRTKNPGTVNSSKNCFGIWHDSRRIFGF